MAKVLNNEVGKEWLFRSLGALVSTAVYQLGSSCENRAHLGLR